MLALGSLSWHHAGGRKCALERLGQQLLSSTLPAVERSMRSVGSYTWEASRFLCAQKYCRNLNPLLSCFRRDPADQVPFECFFISDLFNTLQVPLWAPPLGPPVCESLISALVAVQMALCWCFTMGLRSVRLMPSTHSNFSTPAV